MLAQTTYLGVLIQGDIGHLLAWVKQAVFGTLAEDILKGSNIHCC
jgi:hypothetical protein